MPVRYSIVFARLLSAQFFESVSSPLDAVGALPEMQ